MAAEFVGGSGGGGGAGDMSWGGRGCDGCGPGRFLVRAVVGGLRWLWTEHRSAVVMVVAVAGTITVSRRIRALRRRRKWDRAGENVVVLHTVPLGCYCPHLSPFTLKLETFFRMAGLKYQYDFEVPMGPKGKTPWITIDGEDIGDSQLIMERLSGRLGVDAYLTPGLTEEQKAVSRAMLIMTDEHLFWGLGDWRFWQDPDLRIQELVTWFPPYLRLLIRVIRYRIKKMLILQGLGRHTAGEREEIMRQDIKAISVYLANKPYLMGVKPSEVDCAVFGMLGQFYWNAPGSPYRRMMIENYPNLKDYCLRMKEQFWPDWNQCLDPPVH